MYLTNYNWQPTPWNKLIFQKTSFKYAEFNRTRLLPCLIDDPATGPHIDQSYLHNIHFNIILISRSTTKFSECSHPFRFSDQYAVSTSHFPQACYMFWPSYHPLFDHSNNVLWKLTTKLFITQFLSLPDTSHFQVFSTAPYSRTPLICVLPLMWHLVLHPYRTTGKITVLFILIRAFLETRREDKTFSTS